MMIGVAAIAVRFWSRAPIVMAGWRQGWENTDDFWAARIGRIVVSPGT